MSLRVVQFSAPLLLVAGLSLSSSLGAQGADAPMITSMTLSTGSVQLGWTAVSTGLAYTVQSRPSLGDGLWLPAASSQPWPISLTQWTDQSAAVEQARFYRVVAVPAAQRGRLVSSTLARTLSTFEIGFLFGAAGIPVTPQHSVQLYKLVYETITPIGGRTMASSALALPVGAGSPLPLVTYQHGTITQTNEAPSSMNLFGEVTVGVAFATTGYAAALPDYLGLGDSPGLHPYQHARSEATAGVDMLRAARAFCASNGVALANRLFLCGYSQGGHAAMALCRELEAFHTNEFMVTACAPMAGAYDMSGVTTDDFLSARPKPNPYYYVYLMAAYQDVYRLASNLAEVLAPPYDTTLPPLMNGNSSGDQINDAMPADPRQVLKPEYLAAFQTNPNHPFRVALRDNDVHVWTPRAPMRLFHCTGDADVVFANSQTALASFHSRGATQVQLVDSQPGADHGDCVLPSLFQAKTWFDSFR